jgi:aminoglycoside 3-N-acetyltransferase
VVEVHSSLRSLGRVEGGAETVLAALSSGVGQEGAIVMSAYPVTPPIPLTGEEIARGLTWKVRILSEDSAERTGMGAIADAFRSWPGVCCGTGLHRVCAWGRDAQWYCEKGYAHLLEVDGWALLMGVGYDRISSLHQAEKVGFPEAVSRCFRIPEEILKDYPAEEWSIGFGSTPEDAWLKVWEEARGSGLVKEGRIGQARCYFFKAAPVAGIYERWLRADPLGLFGVPKNEVHDGSAGRKAPAALQGDGCAPGLAR